VVAAALAFLVITVVASASTLLDVTVLPGPGFPPRANDVEPTGARLVLVSSRYRAPSTLPPPLPDAPAWAPRTFRGDDLRHVIRQGRRAFFLYGPDVISGRYVVGADLRTRALRYAFDFAAFSPPRGWFEPVTWARETDGVLYVSNSHLTYASATRGRNAYVSAIDLRTKRTRWRSPALVANARTFVVAGDLIVGGYGFTSEQDFLYLLDRRTGKVLDRLELPTAPEVVKLRGNRLHVRTYDHVLVARIARS
jgi:hypothetical protein